MLGSSGSLGNMLVNNCIRHLNYQHVLKAEPKLTHSFSVTFVLIVMIFFHKGVYGEVGSCEDYPHSKR